MNIIDLRATGDAALAIERRVSRIHDMIERGDFDGAEDDAEAMRFMIFRDCVAVFVRKQASAAADAVLAEIGVRRAQAVSQ